MSIFDHAVYELLDNRPILFDLSSVDFHLLGF